MRRPGKELRLQKREALTFCFCPVGFALCTKSFENGFRDLTLCFKVLRIYTARTIEHTNRTGDSLV